MHEIIINNQFQTKQVLKIALEIARYNLSSEQIDRINNIIRLIDNSNNNLKLTITKEKLLDLKECVTIFMESESIVWIRDDFTKDVMELQNHLINDVIN